MGRKCTAYRRTDLMLGANYGFGTPCKLDDFIVRGTVAWDNREKLREADGCLLLCYGAIPQGEARGEKNYVTIPPFESKYTPKKVDGRCKANDYANEI